MKNGSGFRLNLSDVACVVSRGIGMRRLVALFLVTATAITLAWWWLGRPLAAPAAAADPGRIQCMSYAPFRAGQSPLVASTHVEAAQIEEDLTKLARLTGCVG